MRLAAVASFLPVRVERHELGDDCAVRPAASVDCALEAPLVVERNDFSFHPTVQCPRVTFEYQRTRRNLWICIPDVDSAEHFAGDRSARWRPTARRGIQRCSAVMRVLEDSWLGASDCVRRRDGF